MAFNDQRQEYVTREYYDKKAKGQVHKDDILITSTGTGTLGRTSIWYKDEPAFNVPENSFLRGPIGVNPYFVAAFLSTKYGTLQLFQNQRGSSGQLHLYPVDIRRIVIPKFLFDYQNEIGDYLIKAFELEEQSKFLYRQAETLFAQELQLDRLRLSYKKWYTANFKEVVESGRCDGEYYQMKYKDLFNYLNCFHCKTLNTIGCFCSGSLISDRYYTQSANRAYIRIKELSLNRPIERNSVVFIDDNFVAHNETTVKTNDFVFATIGNTIGKVNVITEDYNNSFISNNTSRYRLNEVDNDVFYYELLFRSPIVQLQIEREYTQTGQPKISNQSLERIIIPIIDIEKRKKVSDYVKQSNHSFMESKSLLAQAKQRVEELIEQEVNKYK